MKKNILLMMLIFFLPVLNSFSQTSTARFLYWSPSAEITAMGGAGVAIVNNSLSAYYNPAGLGFNRSLNVAGTFMQPNSSFYNTAQAILSVSFPFEDVGTFAASLNAYWFENQLRTGSNDPSPFSMTRDQPEFFDPTHLQIKLSYATEIGNDISLGISTSLLMNSLITGPTEGEKGKGSNTTLMADIGILVKDLLMGATFTPLPIDSATVITDNIRPGVSIGFSFLNLGPKIFFIDKEQSDPPPSFALLGISYTPIYTYGFTSRLLLDIEKRIYDSDKIDFIHFGGEVRLFKLVSLRAGYLLNNVNDDLSYPTFGFGINLKLLNVNVSRYKKYIVPTWQFDAKISLELLL